MKRLSILLLSIIILGCTSKNISGDLLSNKDIPGIDFAIRFPGSIRIAYTNDSCNATATYYVPGNLTNEIKEFYKNNVEVWLFKNNTFFKLKYNCKENITHNISINDTFNNEMLNLAKDITLVEYTTNQSIKQYTYKGNLTKEEFEELVNKTNPVYKSYNEYGFSIIGENIQIVGSDGYIYVVKW